MAYPLAGLLRVRDFRANNAAKAVVAGRIALVAAEAALEKARAELVRYRQWRHAEVERRYQSIIGQTLAQDDLERFKRGLAALADAEQEKEAICDERERDLNDARKRLTEARAALREIEREREKLRLHFDLWRDAEMKAALHKEDQESEEFKPVLFTAEGTAEE